MQISTTPPARALTSGSSVVVGSPAARPDDEAVSASPPAPRDSAEPRSTHPVAAFAANLGAAALGGLVGGTALALAVGLASNPAGIATFVRIGLLFGSVAGAVGGSIGAALAARKRDEPLQLGRAFTVGAATGPAGVVAAFGVVAAVLSGMS
jgi:hypothetical protein